MRLNTRVFLAINRLVGKNRFADWFGWLGAEVVIFMMLAGFIFLSFLSVRFYGRETSALQPFGILFVAWVLGESTSLLLAIFVREPRPHTTHPTSRRLLKPWMNWKSFPSDHAMCAWLMVFVAGMVALPGAYLFIPLAVWVGWGRVYAGVHYPVDILGGLLVAAGAASVIYVSPLGVMWGL